MKLKLKSRNHRFAISFSGHKQTQYLEHKKTVINLKDEGRRSKFKRKNQAQQCGQSFRLGTDQDKLNFDVG